MDRNKRDWQKIEDLFHSLADKDQDARLSLLDEIRTKEPDTYNVLQSLLDADEHPNRIFGNDPQEVMKNWQNDQELIGKQIGSFRLEKAVGQGAMGTVFMASRADGQFEQTVAIKLLRSQMLISTHRELFDRERQILAKLNHPGIARLYDGGFTGDGRPYFTMEWISGQTLTEYIRQNCLSLKSRLKLFKDVCEAVRYAHQMLIAHLDLKPGNILVNENGNVKLLDFGVSRLIDENSETPGSFTLAYAAPEQIKREGANTGSDIYALGVILYEILADAHPYQASFSDRQQLKKRILNGDYQPLKPDKNSGNKDFDDDLRLICEKAMATEPDQRYTSVDELAGDIDAWGDHYPISIRRRDLQYVGGKYFRRHRTLITAITIALIALIGSAVYYTVQLREQRNIAEEQAKKASQITDLLTDVFMAADPNVGGADTITAVNLLDQGAANLKKNLADDPVMQADMQTRLADIYFNLGQYEKGTALARDAVILLNDVTENTSELKAIAGTMLIKAYYYYGNLDSAEIVALDVIAGSDNPEVSEETRLGILFELANVYNDQGRITEADSLYRLCYEGYLNIYEPPNSDIAFALHMLGSTSRDLGNLETAEDYFMKSLAMKRELFDEPHLEIAYTYNYLGSLNQSKGDLEAALKYITMSYEQRKAILGEFHVETMASMANMARTYNRMGRYEEAIDVYDRTLVIIDSLFGKDHYYYAGLIGSQGTSYYELGKYPEARERLAESHRLHKLLNPTNVLRQVPPLIKLGDISMKENKLQEAKEFYQEVLSIREQALPAGDKQIAQSQQTLGECLLDLGDYATAIEYLESALETFENSEEKDDDAIMSLNSLLASAYGGLDDPQKAGYYESRLTASE